MATIVNNPQTERVVERESNTGWIIAVLVLIVVIAAGAFLWLRYYHRTAPATSNGGTNINVTVPALGEGNSTGQGGAAE